MNRQRPPSRMSISRVSVVKPSGPNQRTTSAGSLQALKTRSRGASSTRDSTISRSRVQVSRAAASVIIIGLLRGWRLQRAQERIEAVEAGLPGFAGVFGPGRGGLQRRRLQPAGPPLSVAAAADQAGAFP